MTDQTPFPAALPDGIRVHDAAPGLAVLTLAGQQLTQGDALQLQKVTSTDGELRPLGRIDTGRRPEAEDGDERLEALALSPEDHLVRVVLYTDQRRWPAGETPFLHQLWTSPTILLADWRQP